MFLLRRTAARAFAAAPSRAILAKPRSIATFTPSPFRPKQQQWSINSLQRRFASDEAVEKEAAPSATTNSPDDFAQTAAEVPMEEDLTLAEQAAHASPTDASAAVGADALEAAVKTAERSTRTSNTSLSDEPVAPHPTLYIGNLYYEVTADQLRRVFSRFGDIESVKLIYDNRGLSRGFGYVEFKNTEDAQTAVDSLNMQVFEGRNLVVQFHRAKFNSKSADPTGGFQANPPSRTLFIGNMSFEMSDKDLNDLFRDVRNVMDVRVAIDRRTGQPRGFAHADFIDVASATRAKEILSEKTIYGRQLRIDYSKSGTQQNRDRQAPSNPHP